MMLQEYNEWGYDVKGFNKDGFDKYGGFACFVVCGAVKTNHTHARHAACGWEH